MVLIESMASGTPVLAFREGSVPEIVVDGVTGFIVDSVWAMVQAVERIEHIDRRKCRRHVERSEEHTSELQSLMRLSYAVFCLKKKKHKSNINNQTQSKK